VAPSLCALVYIASYAAPNLWKAYVAPQIIDRGGDDGDGTDADDDDAAAAYDSASWRTVPFAVAAPVWAIVMAKVRCECTRPCSP